MRGAEDTEEARKVTVRRIGERLQEDAALVDQLRRVGVRPGAVIRVQRAAEGFLVGSSGEYVELGRDAAAQLVVEPVG